MTEKGIASRVTVIKLLHAELIPDGKVIDKKEGNSFHRLYINDKSEYQRLITRIDSLCKAVTDLRNIIFHSGFKTPSLKLIMHVSQTRLHQAIISILRDIMMSNKLTAESERQALCMRLIDGLAKVDGFSSLSNKIATLNIIQKLTALSERGEPDSKESKTILELMDILHAMG